ncbi:uncharacterized protein PAC_08307 [Phialocephala subalpina]|uniref:Glycoside hydrolase 131 catalytic N-terminal domain-containing protein n=1 Tax=Phialocephala subalpina TaxID=576137 RepID=A0A1L7X067_9HELO|nr:uncharacterized protein PAC_08307 [Phialocephala subalpina]
MPHYTLGRPKYTKGQNLSWSEILLLPDVDASRFDFASSKAVELTINDSSIFLPGGGKPQIGFRRAGLVMGNGSDASNVGVRTFHWSVQQEPQKRMNLTHENNDVVWMTEIEWDDWQNFAVTLDYEKNTLQVWYSLRYEPLRAVTKALQNDDSGGGQYQIGMAKKPTETVGVVYDGFQESGIHEGQIYGGIFIENSSGGCISK